MPRRTFNFSLADLLLAAICVSACLGGVITFQQAGALYEKQKEMTIGHLYNLAWRIREHMDQTQSEFYPANLAELFNKPKNRLSDNVPAHTNPRLAELDLGFYTIEGIKRQDMGCIWLYENVPVELGDNGRVVLLIQGEALVPLWLDEESFQRELKATMSRPGTKIVANDRTVWGWPSPDAEITANHIVFSYIQPKSGARIVTADYPTHVRRNSLHMPAYLFGIAFLFALALYLKPIFAHWNKRRAN